MRALIIGCGYTGIRLGKALSTRGHRVFGLRRSPDARAELMAAGITPLQGSVTDGLAGIKPEFDWVINTVSSSRGGVDEYRAVYLDGTQKLIDWMRHGPPQKYVYTSSTSVYGQTDGSVVDETSPTEPASPTSAILIETEQLLRASALPAVILRASGIYGPTRGHLFQQYVKGEATLRGAGDHFINMIHVHDLVGAIIQALELGEPGETYNASDNEPVPQIDFFRWLSSRLGKPMPPQAPPDANRKRGLTNKQVSNQKLREILHYNLNYPTFREGYEPEIARLHLAPGAR